MKRWQFWVGLLVSVVLLFLALRKVDLAAAWHNVLTARGEYIALGWLCLVVSYGVRTWRWHAIVRTVGHVSPWTLGQVYMAGYMANNILPARIGEVVRAYLLGQTAQVSTASALGTIAVERVFDVIMALTLLALGAAFGVLGDISGSLWLGGAMVGGLVAGLVVLAVWGAQLSDLLERMVGRVSPAWGKRLADLARSFVQGLRSVGSVRRAAWVAVWSVVVWGFFTAYAYLILRAYDLRVTLAGAAFLLGVAGLGVSIPSAPGNVGTLEGAYIFALQLLGTGDENSRASFALTYHVVEWVTTCAIGLFCLGRLGLSLGQLSRMSESLEHATDGG
jgi:uncharacterized protein (TIRG00374 family)